MKTIWLYFDFVGQRTLPMCCTLRSLLLSFFCVYFFLLHSAIRTYSFGLRLPLGPLSIGYHSAPIHIHTHTHTVLCALPLFCIVYLFIVGMCVRETVGIGLTVTVQPLLLGNNKNGNRLTGVRHSTT